jgi:hypothetical protein
LNPLNDWDACARKMDECEKLSAHLQTLEAAFRRRAERARDERDITTMVRMRDAVRLANDRKSELAALAGGLATDLTRAQTQPTEASFDALMARLEVTASKWRELEALYEPFVEWEAEPS